MRAVYVLGAAGSGKSTFTAALLESMEAVYGPLEDLASLPNRKNLVVLRGHRLASRGRGPGMYLGVRRESFPGTDGLDRASSPVGVAWLESEPLPDWLVAEGATLATRPFLTALATHADLLTVHLKVGPEEARRRFAERGSSQKESFVAATATRSANRAAELAAGWNTVLEVDTENRDSWDLALDLARLHLDFPRRWML